MAHRVRVQARPTGLRHVPQRLAVVVMALVIIMGVWDPTPLTVTAVESKAPGVEDAAKPVTVHPTSVAVDAAPIDLAGLSTGGVEVLADGTTIRPSSPGYTPPISATEVVSLRDAGSKVTANADGTFTLEASSGRLNYQDADGAWQPIDLTLITDPTTGDLKVKGLDSDVTIGTGDDPFLGSVSTASGRATLRAVGYSGGEKVLDQNVVTYASPVGAGTPAPSPESTAQPTAASSRRHRPAQEPDDLGRRDGL